MGWRKNLHCLLRHPERPSVLLMRSDRWWAPPRIATRAPMWVGSAEVIGDHLERRLGARPWILRIVRTEIDDNAEQIDLYVEAEMLDGNWSLPTNGRWVAADDLAGLRLRPASIDAVHRYLTGLGRPAPKRQPWNSGGWLEGVVDWLKGLPIGEIHRIDQVKQWGISNSMRIDTASGVYYFKVSAPLPLFANEATVVPALAALLPEFVEAPIAIDEEKGWLLTRDQGAVEEVPTTEDVAALLGIGACLHINSIGIVDRLLVGGCVDRRLPVFVRQAEALLADDRVMARLSVDDRVALEEMDVPGLCDRLDSCGFPVTLLHGDLHPGNAIGVEGGHRLIDWSDASIGHPLFDLHMVDDTSEPRRTELERSYLEKWGDRISRDDGEMATSLARVLRPLHHGVSYQVIAEGLETPGELDFAHEFLIQAAAALRSAQAL